MQFARDEKVTLTNDDVLWDGFPWKQIENSRVLEVQQEKVFQN